MKLTKYELKELAANLEYVKVFEYLKSQGCIISDIEKTNNDMEELTRKTIEAKTTYTPAEWQLQKCRNMTIIKSLLLIIDNLNDHE